MVAIYPFPPNLLSAETARCFLRRQILQNPSPLRSARRTYGTVDERWVIEIATGTLDEARWQELEAIIHLIDGPVGFVRAWDPARVLPRGRAAGRYQEEQPGVGDPFSDSELFSDGTGFVDGGSVAAVDVALARGSRWITLSGLIPSRDDSILYGDKVEIEGFMYMAVSPGRSDAAGKSTFQIRPRLRTPLRGGELASFLRASSVFALRDDQQGIVDRRVPRLGTFSIDLVEIPEALQARRRQ